MKYLSYEQLMELIVRALNKMDERLSGHGERVAYRVMLAMQKDGRFSDEEICRLVWTVLLHDIGNYQHLDIFDLMERETQTAGSHARYGYLFLKHFGPYPNEAAVVLYHHSSCETIEESNMSESLKWVSHILITADMLDLYRVSYPEADQKEIFQFLDRLDRKRHHSNSIEVLREIESQFSNTRNEIHTALLKQLSRIEISEEEQQAFLKVLVSSIDFRSHATALHCAIIVNVSDGLAKLCKVTEQELQEIHIGAILHDLGKIAIPISILESSGKLEGNDWAIMKSHIVLTEELLDGIVSESIKNIAVRHHETLDGTGYPRGLTKEELSLPQRILAVADIVSALSEERSYKKAFSLEDVVQILDSMVQRGKLCSKVVDILKNNKEIIYEIARQTGKQTQEDFQHIYKEFSLDCYKI